MYSSGRGGSPSSYRFSIFHIYLCLLFFHVQKGSSSAFRVTNPQAEGRVSTDRSVETALPDTTPRQVRKSSADNSEFRHRMQNYPCWGRLELAGRGGRDPAACRALRADVRLVRRSTRTPTA